MKQRINKFKLLTALALIIFGSLGRLFLTEMSGMAIIDLPNVETITISALLAGAFLGGAYTLVVPLAIVALTDLKIGNSPILLFTWSAWAVIGLFGWFLRKRKKNTWRFSLEMTGMGIGASVFFFLWTNFGVWLMWPKMYPMTLAGLIQCYIMALPFFKYNLLGNLVIVPVLTSVGILVYRKVKSWQQRVNLTLKNPAPHKS